MAHHMYSAALESILAIAVFLVVHHCFLPGGNITSPSLMFLSLKLDIRGLNPQSSITLPLGVAINHLANVKYGNGEHARITQELKYKREEPIILLNTI